MPTYLSAVLLLLGITGAMMAFRVAKRRTTKSTPHFVYLCLGVLGILLAVLAGLYLAATALFLNAIQ